MCNLTCAVLPLVWAISAAAPAQDTPFMQEYRAFYIDEDAPVNDVRAIAVDGDDRVWTATPAGIQVLLDGQWRGRMREENAGPAFAAATGHEGTVWLGAWNGLYKTAGTHVEKVPGVDQPIGAVIADAHGVVALGPFGMWHNEGDGWQHVRGQWADSARSMVRDNDGTVWLATAHGLFHLDGAKIVHHIYREADIRSGDMAALTIDNNGRLWVGGLNGIDVFQNAKRVKSYTAGDGLPHLYINALACGPDGSVWAGTHCGVARLGIPLYEDGYWSVRHSKRWLPGDEVRDIAFDSAGTGWVATKGGVSAIKKRPMTLEQKAAYYAGIVAERKIREPWIVEKSRLLVPGDVSTWRTEDDDNDGSYTAIYMAAEAYRYKVTGDPEARENARRAFGFLEMLQAITGTQGFIARTVIPVWWTDPDKNDNPYRVHDRNRTYTPREIASVLVRDPRYKPVEQRWIPSEDGQWLWKRDTSSDEVVGHFYGFLMYYDLIAETEAEKERARGLARVLMDHIIDGGFVLRDVDGEHTRWGVWSPEKLLGDMDWLAERPVNATEILSFLKATYYMTGDEKYERHYRNLIDEHGYLQYARAPKPTDPSQRTHIDAELLSMTFPALFTETDPELRSAYLEGLHQWFSTIGHEFNPYFNFVAGAYGVEEFNRDDAVFFLRDMPLDLIRWTVDNAKRQDIEIRREPTLIDDQTDTLPPPSERGVMRWDKNPWTAVRGDGGRTESSGVFWLLPYWMGRYHGFIAAPEEG